MKVAIIHEMLVKIWWAEKVVESFMKLYPDADLYTLIYDEDKVWSMFPKEKIAWTPSVTKAIYNLTKKQRLCLPYMSLGVESLDLSEYDLVLCSSSWFMHWAITKPQTKFIVYSHSPARYLWDWTNEYKRDIWFSKWLKGYFMNKMMKKLRIWDVMASSRADIVIANSNNTASRIKKYHRRDAEVVFPPVEVNRFKPWKKWDYYIMVSALTEFKKIEVAIEAFNKMPDKKLKIVWKGDYGETLKKLATSENIEFLWAQYGKDLEDLVSNSKGYIFPWEEDFGITPVEAMAASKPVFALRAWGLLETNIENVTWEFFDDKDGSDFIEKFKEFDKKIDSDFYDDEKIRENALRFSEEAFHENLLRIINKM